MLPNAIDTTAFATTNAVSKDAKTAADATTATMTKAADTTRCHNSRSDLTNAPDTAAYSKQLQ